MKKKFPLWKNDGKPAVQFENLNRDNVDNLIEAIKRKDLILVENKCLCNNEHEDIDIVIAEKDRFGLPIPQVLCSKCGLIRSKFVFDEKSNDLFYEKYYRGIYTTDMPSDKFFQDQVNTGIWILNLLKQYLDVTDISNVVEIGCGAGGILLPFLESSKSVSGYDFDEKYLEYGRSKGINLYYGDFYKQTDNNKYDLIILNHVLEHLLSPLEEIGKLLPKLRIGKYLYIQVPGIYCISDIYKNPLTYFQNAHVYNFFEQYFRVFFTKFGLKVIYGDERCTFICQKVSEEIPDVKFIYDESLSMYPQKNAEYLLECKKRYDIELKLEKRNRFERKLRNIACYLGWDKTKKCIKKIKDRIKWIK